MTGKLTQDAISAAQASHVKWGCPASVTLAQWALESAWGTRMSGKNNPFGIKAKAGEPSTSVRTWEVIAGARVAMHQEFRDFATVAEAFDAHGRLLATGPAYAAARAVANDPKAFARALTGHYATDPRYGAKLIAIMDAGNMYVFDTPSLLVPMPKPPAPKARVTAAGAASAGAVVVATSVSLPVTGGHPLAVGILVAALIALAVFLFLHFRDKA